MRTTSTFSPATTSWPGTAFIRGGGRARLLVGAIIVATSFSPVTSFADPVCEDWTLYTPAGPEGTIGHAMAYDSARGVTVLFGGYNIVTGWLNDTWEWNGTAWNKRIAINNPGYRPGYAMAYDSARGVSVLFGGASESNDNSIWEWDGTTWAQRNPAVSRN